MDKGRYFFCGVGGSGMLPLAMMIRARGAVAEGSDRSRDQGRTPEKFAWLERQGVRLYPQDGSGVTSPDQTVVVSAAVEETVPDVVAARRVGAQIVTRAALLSQLCNAARTSLAVAGTSGKSTTTGMLGFILHRAGLDPTIVNGAVMKNFMAEDTPFASALAGSADLVTAEVDESDGSIALYNPTIAVLNNIALDHKSMDELRTLFGAFVGRSQRAVLSVDNAETAAIAGAIGAKAITWSINGRAADYMAKDIVPAQDGIAFDLDALGASTRVRLRTPGRHNVSNALAAIAAAGVADVAAADAAAALADFQGIKRRLEIAGVRNGVTVIDDFAHNPDKIAATLATLRDFPGRLLLMFQPSGFGPLALTRDELIESFVSGMSEDDLLVMPPPLYFGGTVNRTVTSADIVAGVTARGRRAAALEDRAACGAHLLAEARPGDRIVVMGARDDTLSNFAAALAAAL